MPNYTIEELLGKEEEEENKVTNYTLEELLGEEEKEDTSNVYTMEEQSGEEEPSFLQKAGQLYTEISTLPFKAAVQIARDKTEEEKDDAARVATNIALGTVKLGYDILDTAQSVFSEEEWGSEAFSNFVRDKSLAAGLDESTVNKVLDKDGKVKEVETAYGTVLDIGSYFAGYAGLRKGLGKAASKKDEVLKATLAAVGVTQVLDDPSNTLANEAVEMLSTTENFNDGYLAAFAEALAAEDDDSIAMQRFKLLAQEPLFVALGFTASKGLQSANWAANKSRKLFNKDLKNLTVKEREILSLSFLDESKQNLQLSQDAPLKIRVRKVDQEETVVPKNLQGIFSQSMAYLSQQGKRFFSSKGQFTTPVFEARRYADVAQRQATSRAEFVAGNLQRSLDNITDATESAETAKKVQNALNSNTSFLNDVDPEDRIEAFAEEFDLSFDVASSTLKARDLIDEMTGKFSNVSIPKAVRESLSNNIGQYLRRSYRMFEDPSYKPPELIEKKAVEYFTNQYIGEGLDEAEAYEKAVGIVNDIIKKGDKTPSEHFEKLSKLNKAIFTARKTDEELPKVVRELLGEIEDPVESVLLSITKASQFYENLKFYETFNNLGTKGKYVFTKSALNKMGDRDFQDQGFVKIEGTNSILDGKYTTKEMHSALVQREEHFATISDNKFYQKFLYAKGMTQAAKTVGSLTTHVRNVSGGAQFSLANGMLPIGGKTDAVKTIIAGAMKKGDQALIDKYDEYLGLGIINTNVKMNEFRKLIAAGFDGDYRGAAQRIEAASLKAEEQLTDAADKALNKAKGKLAKGAGKVIEGPIGRGTDIVFKGAENIYMGVDDFYKIHAYEKELLTLKEAFPNTSEKLLRQEAAEVIKSTFPTYDRVPPGIKAIRELPLGNFVAFPAEIIRTSGNILRRASKEITSGNGILLERGLRRLGGFTGSMSAWAGASYGSAAALGWTDEKREGAEVLAETPWSKNSSRIFMTMNDKIVSIDTQFLDSYSAIKEPLFSAVGEIREGRLKGDDLDKTLFNASQAALKNLLTPYFSESMLTTVMLDIGYAATSDDGKGRKGQKYFAKEQDMLDRSEAVLLDVLQTFVPGTFTTAYSISEAITAVPKRGGETIRYRDTAQELYKASLGINFTDFTPEDKLYFTGAEFSRKERSIGSANPDWTKAPEELLKQHRLIEKARFENFQELYRIYKAAVKFYGPENTDIALTKLGQGGVSKKIIKSIEAGIFMPIDPSKNRMYSIERKTKDLESGQSAASAYYDQAQSMMYLSLEDPFEDQLKKIQRLRKDKGGEVLDVPNTAPEPDERIDKMTGMPYNQQAGAAFTDVEDREDPLQRMGFVEGSKVTTKGRKVYEDEKGKYSERTETIQLDNGEWVNYPTIDKKGNKIPEQLFKKLIESQLTKDGAVDFITGETLPTYKDMDTAIKAAKKRSDSLLKESK